MPRRRKPTLQIQGYQDGPEEKGLREVRIVTDSGPIECRYHTAETGDGAAVWVFGAGGGLGGPAGGLYTRLAEILAREGVASLRLDYRRPGDLHSCILDVVAGTLYLQEQQRSRIVLIGHSFGGAVVINAGVISPSVVGVAALSSQTAGTEAVADLSPKHLLLMHGAADEVLPDSCSRGIYERAGEPKQLLIYPNCRHGLDDCREEVDRDLIRWLRERVATVNVLAV
jgi:alpha-beta hydrolase superfamily lysophospholipase